MDEDMLRAAFASHTAETEKGKPGFFTRRMAILLAHMADTTPREVVQRCERLGLLKHGAWQWFADNGGITKAQIHEVLGVTGR